MGISAGIWRGGLTKICRGCSAWGSGLQPGDLRAHFVGPWETFPQMLLGTVKDWDANVARAWDGKMVKAWDANVARTWDVNVANAWGVRMARM